MKPEFNMQWGDPFIVRQALVETLRLSSPVFTPQYKEMSYPQHVGNPKLIRQLKKLTERQSGTKFKHLIVTNGATGAINAALYSLKDFDTDYVVTNKRYFPMFPAMISMADMVMIDKNR